METVLKEIKTTEKKIHNLKEETDKAIAIILAEGKSKAAEFESKEKEKILKESEKKTADFKKSAKKLRNQITKHAEDEITLLNSKVKKNKDKSVNKILDLFEENLNV